MLSIVIPWRAHPRRPNAALDIVLEWWRTTIPDAGIELVDSPERAFARGTAINRGVARAHAQGAELVVITDGDLVVEAPAVLDAIALARSTGRLVLPFTHYRALTPEATADVLDGRGDPFAAEAAWVDCWATGASGVIRIDAFLAAGGFDERFMGWGFEDTAFRTAADTLIGRTLRVAGRLAHFHHEAAERDPELYAAGQDLGARYDAAHYDPCAMRRLLDERP